jgi:hypothetical protein
MANNGPIAVSAPNTSLQGAVGTDITFSTRYPFAKLDTTNPVSFQVLSIFFNTTPPQPTAVNTSTNTLVYSYPHGYKYIPSTWFLLSTDNFATVAGNEGATIINPNSGVGASYVNATIIVDSTNVNVYIYNFWGGSTSSPYSLVGYTLSIRAYIFIEDLSGNSVPAQA